MFAHLRVGEAASSAPGSERSIPPGSWATRPPAGRRHGSGPARLAARLIEQARALYARGYHGLFLEGLDAYETRCRRPPSATGGSRPCWPGWRDMLARAARLQAAVSRRPGPVSAGPRPSPPAWCVGSLFSGWDAARQRYREVPAAERDTLLARLAALRAARDLPVTVVDRVARRRIAARAREVAAADRPAGLLPLGGRRRARPPGGGLGRGGAPPGARRVRQRGGAAAPTRPPTACWPCPLEYYGLAVDYLDASGPLPPGRLEETYAGIVTMLTDDTLPAPQVYRPGCCGSSTPASRW